jgi:hypothetical protein
MPVRLVLDTSAVRKHLHRDADRIDLEMIRKNRDDLLVSLPDIAPAELVKQLLEASIKWGEWGRIAELDALLDPVMPVIAGGRELALISGLFPVADFDEEDSRRYYKAGWNLLVRSRSRSALSRGIEYRDRRGRRRRRKLRAEPNHIDQVFEDERRGWKEFLDEMKGIPGLAEQPRAEIGRIVDLAMTPGAGEAADLPDKLEAQRRILARYIAEYLRKKEPYNPVSPKNKGDIIDFTMLMVLALPDTVICTADENTLIKRLREGGSNQLRRVITPQELNQHLNEGTLLERFSIVRST